MPGERGAKECFLGNTEMSPESKSTVKDIQKEFGAVAVDVHKYKRQGDVQ